MSQNVEDLYPSLFVTGGVYDRLWTPNGVSVEELRDLFKQRVKAPNGSDCASAGMTMVVQRTHCMFSPAMYRLTRQFVDKQGLLAPFMQLVPQPIESQDVAERALRSRPDWQSKLILGLMLDGLHGYPEARGWVRAAMGHMLCGNVTILEVLVQYIRDCDRDGVQYIIGASEQSVIVSAELKELFVTTAMDHHELEYDILRVLSARAPVEFLMWGHTLSQRTRVLAHLYSECIRNTGTLWVTPEQARALIGASWLLPEHRSRLRQVWAQYL